MTAFEERARGWIAAVSVAVMISAGGCGPADPATVTVARVGGRVLTLAAFEAFLSANLDGGSFEDPMTPAESERVRSRLFDDFIDEALLVAEAERRGLTASDREAQAWLEDTTEGGGAPADAAPPKEDARERARHEILVHKLLDAVESEDDGADPEVLLGRLRATIPIELHVDRLPFRYQPDPDRPGAVE